MASLSLQLLLLVLVSAGTAWSSTYYKYRYFGGSLSFTPKGHNSDGKYEVEIRNRQTSYYCRVHNIGCQSGNCGTSVSMRNRHISSNSYGLTWCQYSTVNRRKLNGNLPFEIRYPTSLSSTYGLGYWIPNIRSSKAYWRVMAHVDLGIRSDTGDSNRSPITTMLPLVRVPKNCPRSFNLTVFDPDDDQVRCRASTSSNSFECGLCGLTSGFTLDQDSCSLTYTYSRSNGYHPIELMVEDFPNKHVTLSYSDGSYTSKRPISPGRPKRAARHTITVAQKTTAPYRKTISPLSKLSLQFSVFVDSHNAPSCLDGDYIPVFLSPTPPNGVNIPAFVNKTLEISVKTKAEYTTLQGLVVTGPQGTSKQTVRAGEYIIRWTPTDNELNDHFPICFVAEARDKSGRIYQSELRCLIADVGHHEAIVTCNETTIKVEVEKSYLTRRHEDTLHLNDFRNSSCNLTTLSNSTHLVAVMSLNSCGTLIEEDDNNIIFKNEITSGDTSAVISRQNDVEIAFSCAFPKRTNLTLGFRHKNPYAFSEKGFGAFTFQFEFFESQRFRKQIASSTYPVEVNLKQMIFMDIEATTSIPNTELFVESCRATPYDNPNSRIGYTIIEHGCVRDKTVQIYPSSKAQFKFGMEAFEFIGAHEEVYITCSVILCESGAPDTRCSQGCIKSGVNRRKREAGAQTSNHFISQGPLRLIKPSDSQASGFSLNLGLNLVFIVGCLLACAVVVYRSRRSRAKYQPLSTSDAD